MHLDLHAIRLAITELEHRGISTVDCKDAGLTERESLEHIRHVVHQWKTPFRAPYSGGNSFNQLVALRHVLERVVQKPPDEAKQAPQADEKQTKSPEASPALKAIPVQEDLPQPASKTKQESHVDRQVIATSKPVSSVPPQLERSPLEQDTYLEQCIADLTRQLLAAPAKKGASVTPITLAGYKLL